MHGYEMVMRLGEPATEERNIKAIFSDGQTAGIKYFSSELEFNKFAHMLTGVKEGIAALNYGYNNHQMDRQDYLHRLEYQWLRGDVIHFIAEFGAASVPLDLRTAIDEVSKELEVTVVNNWPTPIHEMLESRNDVRYMTMTGFWAC